MKPLLFVTGHVPPERVEPFRLLAEREEAEFALFGGRSRHAAAEDAEADLPFAHRRVDQRAVHALAASGRYRGVVCGTLGRVALPAAHLGARRAGVPFVLWSALWSHPRSVAGALGWPWMRRILRGADAVVTYGPHVSAYARRHGARNVHVAPQAVDNAFWSAPATAPEPRPAPFTALFVGRGDREKGLPVLLDAWRQSGLTVPEAALVVVGEVPAAARRLAPAAVRWTGPRPATEVRNFHAAADVTVVPSIATATFREPWGLVVNEAMNQALPVISSDSVGAAAGGLVRHGANGLIFPSGAAPMLAAELRRLAGDPTLRRRLGEQGRGDVAEFTFGRWVEGFSAALGTISLAKEA